MRITGTRITRIWKADYWNADYADLEDGLLERGLRGFEIANYWNTD